MKNTILFSLFALSLTACSGSGGGGGNNGGTDPNQQNVEKNESKVSYRFDTNGCDTGKHDFATGRIEDTKKQLCEALQDDQLNNSCAEPLRQDFFNKKCSGYSWNPKYQQSNPPANLPYNPPSSNIDYAKEEKVRNSLKNVLVESATVANSLAGQEKVFANQIAQDLMSCGLSFVGPKCLDYLPYASNYGVTLNEVDRKYVFYSELKIKGTGTPIAFVFSVDQFDPAFKIKKLIVSKIVRARNGQSIAEYLKDESNLSALVQVQIADDFQAGAWKRLQKPRDIRELYHVSKMLLETSMTNINSFEQTKAKLVSVFQNNKAVIVDSDDVRYQEEVLSFIKNEIPVSSQSLVSICEGLINSKSENIRQFSATTILDTQPSRSELKPTVVIALNNQRWDIRRKAISALSKTIKTTSEENQLLSKLNDQDEDVRKEAVKASLKISVSVQHLETVKQLSVCSIWSTRAEGVKLLSRINSESSIKELIAKMDDQDEDVRKEVVNQLNQKNLGQQYVSSLAKQLGSSIWSVRNDSAKFLGKIDTDSSTSTLIGSMGDQDEDVRNGIAAQLSGRTLTNESVFDLKNNFSSSVWSVRRDVAKLLSKIKSPASLEALQDQLTKENDEDVRKQIVASIKIVKG